VGIRNFTKEALNDMKVREMAHQVLPKPEIDLINVGFTPAIVEITTKDGRTCSKQIDYPFGSPSNPMNLADVEMKFKYCCQYSAKQISDHNQNKVIQMIGDLEKIHDVSQIIRLLG
jgi:2-methylcitrate dehydratase PrpD